MLVQRAPRRRIASSAAVILPRAQVIEPRLHDERLVQMLRIDRIPVDPPSHRSIPQPDPAQLMNRLRELRIILHRNPILNRDSHRPIRRLSLQHKLRCRSPRLERRMVRHRPLQNPKTPHKRIRNQQTASRRRQRNRSRSMFRNCAPQHRPQSHPALKRHHVSPQRPRLHPCRHSQLHAHIDRRHRARPRRSRQNQRSNNQRRAPHIRQHQQHRNVIKRRRRQYPPPRKTSLELCAAKSPRTPLQPPASHSKCRIPSGPCFKSRRATTASSDHIAEMKNVYTNARTSEACRSGALPHISQPRTDRPLNSFRRQSRLEQRNPLPVHQHPDHARKRQRI